MVVFLSFAIFAVCHEPDRPHKAMVAHVTLYETSFGVSASKFVYPRRPSKTIHPASVAIPKT